MRCAIWIVLAVMPVWPVALAQTEERQEESAPEQQESPGLPEAFHGLWHLDIERTVAIQEGLNAQAREEFVRTAYVYSHLEILLAEHETDTIPSSLGEPVPITVLEVTEDRAAFEYISPDTFEPIRMTVKLLEPNRIRLEMVGGHMIYTRVVLEEIINGDPVEFLTGTWRIDLKTLRKRMKLLSEGDREEIVEEAGDVEITVTPESFDGHSPYELVKAADNRYAVEVRGGAVSFINIDGPDAITLIGLGHEFPLRRVEPDENKTDAATAE